MNPLEIYTLLRSFHCNHFVSLSALLHEHLQVSQSLAEYVPFDFQFLKYRYLSLVRLLSLLHGLQTRLNQKIRQNHFPSRAVSFQNFQRPVQMKSYKQEVIYAPRGIVSSFHQFVSSLPVHALLNRLASELTD